LPPKILGKLLQGIVLTTPNDNIRRNNANLEESNADDFFLLILVFVGKNFMRERLKANIKM
jgi:hypothetical protein